MNGTHSTPNVKSSSVLPSRPFNNFLTPIRTTGPSLQQLIPCLTTTTTATNKTTMIKKAPTIVTNSSHLPSSSTASVSHDIVDLTEEDDEDNKGSTHKISPVKAVSIFYSYLFIFMKILICF